MFLVAGPVFIQGVQKPHSLSSSHVQAAEEFFESSSRVDAWQVQSELTAELRESVANSTSSGLSKTSLPPPSHPSRPVPQQQEHVWKSLLAGGLSGCIAKSVTAPLDRVKILFQGNNPTYSHYAGRPFGVFRAVSHIYSTQGVLGLFQGHSAMLLRIFPSAAIRFMAYDHIRLILIPTPEQSSPWKHFLAGSLAGNLAVSLTYPLDTIRARLAFQMRSNVLRDPETGRKTYGLIPTMRMIYAENGNSLRGFYKGYGATMIGIVPYAGAAFSTYQWAKDKAVNTPNLIPYTTTVDKNGKRKLRIWAHLTVGALGGMIGQTVSYPFDTIRHRMQLYGVAKNIPLYRSTWHALKLIRIQETWRGLFRGLSINYWKTMPANAVGFVAYDKLKHWLGIADDASGVGGSGG